jgi:hypothetical protein
VTAQCCPLYLATPTPYALLNWRGKMLSKEPKLVAQINVQDSQNDNPDALSEKYAIHELRKLVIEIRILRGILNSVANGSTTLERSSIQIKEIHKSIECTSTKISQINEEHIRNVKLHCDKITDYKLLSAPEEFCSNGFTMQDILRTIFFIDTQLELILFESSYWTVPQKIHEWIIKSNLGSVIPFHVIFEEEMADEDYQRSVLDHITSAPELIGGYLKGIIVDSAKRLIYRSGSNREIRMRFFLLFLVILIGTSIITLAPYIMLGAKGDNRIRFMSVYDSSLPDDPIRIININAGNFSNYLAGWAIVLVGALVYSITRAVRRATEGFGLSVLPFRRAWYMLGARVQMHILTILVLFIGYLAIVYAFGVPTLDNGEGRTFFFINAFLIGYSLDSLAEMFGSSIDQRAAEQQTRIRKQLEG